MYTTRASSELLRLCVGLESGRLSVIVWCIAKAIMDNAQPWRSTPCSAAGLPGKENYSGQGRRRGGSEGR